MDSDDYELSGEGDRSGPLPFLVGSRVSPPELSAPRPRSSGIEHRCPKPFWGVLSTKPKRRKPLLCLRFRLSSSRITSHVFTPDAAQERARASAIEASDDEYPSRSLDAYRRRPVRGT
jgi:hypothetical protein